VAMLPRGFFFEILRLFVRVCDILKIFSKISILFEDIFRKTFAECEAF
jgi:hypothetical protein